ncbi:glycoside hydrolase family 9 protein [Streptomyces sp. 4N509B]|uniref:glycoside hydrolase family 9 protein n=1 Tax=Streptomyces sp. 4N509B TaxID=3457413 RepID=UPI003FD38379
MTPHPHRRRRRLLGGGAVASAAGLLAAAIALPSATTASGQPGPELISNGDFASGETAPWWWTQNITPEIVDGRLCAEIPGGTANPWDVIIGQDALPLTAAESYEFRYTPTSSPEGPVRANIQMPTDPYTSYLTAIDTATDATEPISHIFTPTVNQPDAQLVFQLGGRDEAFTFCVDDVSLTSGAEVPPFDPDTGSPVRVNQHGYLTDAAKVGTYVTESTEALPFTVNAADGTEVASGTTSPAGVDPTSAENVHTFDFSEVATPGEDYTVTVGEDTSLPFAIGDDVYAGLGTDALAYYYHNRSGIEIDAALVGEEYARPAGHANVEPNQGDDGVTCWQDACDYTLDAAGGWYDAGDHGKYVVNGGISVAQLMSIYERDPEAFGDSSLAVPEQGNAVPDILDEARWQLDFLMSMQVPEGEELAGMAHHKLHDAAWTALPTIPHEDSQPRELHPPSTAATLNLAAAGAQCARVFEPFDADFAAQCLTAAERAWQAAQANPDMLADPNDGVGGGAYSDAKVSDEFYWAAAELYLTTGEGTYEGALLDSELHGDAEAVFPDGGMSWGETAGLGALSLATVPNDLNRVRQANVDEMVLNAADRYAATAQAAPYGLPYGEGFIWGSNSQVLNNGVVLGVAHDLTGEAAYRDAALGALDYVLGRNPLNQSYVTGYGERDSVNQHHRFWANQLDPGLPNPPAGSLAGGPNADLQDPIAEQELVGCVGAMCYIDHIESYATNEVTINWNAPLAWLAAYADDQGGDA